MAKGLRFHFKEEAEETAKFVEHFDKFFDMFNVTNYTKCYKERKMFQAPYRMGNDSRLEVINVNKYTVYHYQCITIIQWLQSVFLPWLKSWEEQVQTRKDLKASERKKMLLSDETLLGVRMSGNNNNNKTTVHV